MAKIISQTLFQVEHVILEEFYFYRVFLRIHMNILKMLFLFRIFTLSSVFHIYKIAGIVPFSSSFPSLFIR